MNFDADIQRRQATLALRTLDIMINVRRRQVSIGRVAAFVKRMALLCFALRTDVLVAFLAAIRTYFVVSFYSFLLSIRNQISLVHILRYAKIIIVRSKRITLVFIF